jgi:hypothetical protein
VRVLLLLIGLVRWLALVPVQLLGVVASLALTRLAVGRARPVGTLAGVADLTDRTLDRLVDHPISKLYRLPRWARFMELSDDQLLPPGRYEPDVAQHRGDWQAQSRAMLLRNPAATLALWIGGKVEKATFTRKAWEIGRRHGDDEYGAWLGVCGTLWHVQAMLPVGGRDLQLNVGFVLGDFFADHWVEPRRAKFRLPAVRLKRRASVFER